MADSAGEKKHEATPFRRMQAREKGQVAKSQDLASAILLLVAVLILRWSSPVILGALTSVMQHHWGNWETWEADRSTIMRQTIAATSKVALGVMPLMGLAFLSAVIVHVSQTGLMFLPEKIAPNFNHINPIAGIKRLFSLTNVTRLGFGIGKVLLIALVLAIGVWFRANEILVIGEMPLSVVAATMWDISMDMTMHGAIALVVLAIADFSFQKWKLEQDLRMTDEEIREEIKSTQGDPVMKQRRRRVQKQLMEQRVAQDVPRADVVVTNPTHLAVAIAYEHETMAAPIVVAKGADALAARIRRIALEHSIPVMERKPLAQALYHNVDIGKPVPVDQYAAVAEVLKYVYQIQGRPIPQMQNRNQE